MSRKSNTPSAYSGAGATPTGRSKLYHDISDSAVTLTERLQMLCTAPFHGNEIEFSKANTSAVSTERLLNSNASLGNDKGPRNAVTSAGIMLQKNNDNMQAVQTHQLGNTSTTVRQTVQDDTRTPQVNTLQSNNAAVVEIPAPGNVNTPELDDIDTRIIKTLELDGADTPKVNTSQLDSANTKAETTPQLGRANTPAPKATTLDNASTSHVEILDLDDTNAQAVDISEYDNITPAVELHNNDQRALETSAPYKSAEPSDHQELYAELVCKVQETLVSASDSNSETPLSDKTLQLFRSYVEGISLSDLEKERAVFSSGHRIRSSILNRIYNRTEMNDEFPFRGRIEKIGSCWDGSKVGQLDEVDKLFILDPTQVIIIHADTDFQTVCVIYNGNEYSVCQLIRSFAKALEKALEGDTPVGMQHNGFAASDFGGVRISGPAVTVLYGTKTQCGSIQKGTMVSVDTTLAVPFKKADILTEIGWKIDEIISVVDN